MMDSLSFFLLIFVPLHEVIRAAPRSDKDRDTKASCDAEKHHNNRKEVCCPLLESTLDTFELSDSNQIT